MVQGRAPPSKKTTSAFEGVLARWGGDQFAVLILDLASREAAMNIAGLLQGELRCPSICAGTDSSSQQPSASRAWSRASSARKDIVREADIALSAAKRHETAKIVSYAPNLAGQAANLVSLEADLHVARKGMSCSCCSSRSSISEPTKWWAPRRFCAGAIR